MQPTPAADDRVFPPRQLPSRPRPQRQNRRETPAYDLSSMLASRGPITRVASMPNMFGDSLFRQQLTIANFAQSTTYDLPPIGGIRNLKIADNSKALPTDRAYFTYHHFQNALEVFNWGTGTQAFSLDRYTVGAEKTFVDGLWSVELRLPFTAAPRLSIGLIQNDNQNVDNLTIIAKRLVYSGEQTVVAVGLALNLPTAGNVTGVGGVSNYTLHNDAVHLAPFIGFARTPTDRFFYQGFLQADVAANGSVIEFNNTQIGVLNEQSLLYVDAATGYWFYRDPTAGFLKGLAGLLELHYTTTLEDADSVSGNDGSNLLTLGNLANRIDLLHLTVGLQAEVGMTSFSIGAVLPVQEDSYRVCDAEVQVFVNRRF
ncbi:MAG: hypothetical protein HQ567_19820 [Candidatus Nealsonbacteria bacterium]|nr:hypothetical protein [Candidatus Nealsonbacteria bacterium]